jgi:hypothetical protein
MINEPIVITRLTPTKIAPAVNARSIPMINSGAGTD